MSTVEQKDASPKGDAIGKLKAGFLNFLYTEKKVPVQVDTAAAKPVDVAPKKEVESVSSPGLVNEDSVKALWAVIEENDQDGFDFLEFNRLLNKKKSLRDVDKYMDVYETAKALDESNPDVKSKLLRSADYYLDILDREKKEFEVAFAELVETEVGEKKKTQQLLLEEIQALEQQKSDLERKVNEKKTVMAGLEDEIAKQDIELQRKSKNFLTTLDHVIDDITTKAENIKLHIPDEKPNESKQA